MNSDGTQQIDELALILKLIDELAIIEKIQPWIMREIGKVFNIDQNLDQSSSVRKAKAKIAQILTNERSAYGDYLSLAKFRTISEQSRNVLKQVLTKTWSRFQQEMKMMSEKKFQTLACSLIPSLRTPSQWETYHLSILRMYRNSYLSPKNLNNFYSHQYPDVFSGNYMNYQFSQRESGNSKFEGLNQMRYPGMQMHMTMANNQMNRIGGGIGMNRMPNWMGNSSSMVNNHMNSSLNPINRQKQSLKNKFPPNMEHMMQDKRVFQQKQRFFSQSNPHFKGLYDKAPDNKFSFQNQGQPSWVPFNQKQVQQMPIVNYQFPNSKFNQTEFNKLQYHAIEQLQKNEDNGKKYQLHKFNAQFGNCRCQGSKLQGESEFFKCKECNYLYHFNCLEINKIPTVEIAITCPRCIISGKTIFQEVAEQLKLNWFVPTEEKKNWVCIIKKKDYKKAINTNNSKVNFIIKLKFLKINGTSFIQDYQNLQQKGHFYKHTNQICVEQEQLIALHDDLPLQVQIIKSEQHKQSLIIFGAFLVKKSSVASVQARYMEDTSYHVGKQFLQAFFANDSDVSINLIDPIIHIPIKIAARGSKCLHPNIFDLHSFLVDAFAKKQRIKCPICFLGCNELRIDDFLTQYISKIEKDHIPMTITIYQNWEIRTDPRHYNQIKVTEKDRASLKRQNQINESHEDDVQNQNQDQDDCDCDGEGEDEIQDQDEDLDQKQIIKNNEEQDQEQDVDKDENEDEDEDEDEQKNEQSKSKSVNKSKNLKKKRKTSK